MRKSRVLPRRGRRAAHYAFRGAGGAQLTRRFRGAGGGQPTSATRMPGGGRRALETNMRKYSAFRGAGGAQLTKTRQNRPALAGGRGRGDLGTVTWRMDGIGRIPWPGMPRSGYTRQRGSYWEAMTVYGGDGISKKCVGRDHQWVRRKKIGTNIFWKLEVPIKRQIHANALHAEQGAPRAPQDGYGSKTTLRGAMQRAPAPCVCTVEVKGEPAVRLHPEVSTIKPTLFLRYKLAVRRAEIPSSADVPRSAQQISTGQMR
ncbi:hypothetical protein FB451DRAFT_1196826 [Mycena latifolia]|nr:hypothetical protein FB451DRAFT_1196826 [Mycena latifolia]